MIDTKVPNYKRTLEQNERVQKTAIDGVYCGFVTTKRFEFHRGIISVIRTDVVEDLGGPGPGAAAQLRRVVRCAGRHQAVAVGSYHSDYHWPTVVQRAGTGITVQCPPHQIPLRAMRPRSAAIRWLRVSLDAVSSEGAHAQGAHANWHHDSADLIATLKERQPAGTP